MSDSYQAIYDAVRSRITGGNIAEAVGEAARQCFDVSHLLPVIAQDFYASAAAMRAPSAVYRPSVRMDGNQWCALYGENLQDGVAGFGNTPAAAMEDFDRNWHAPRGVSL